MDERLFTAKEYGKVEWEQKGAYYYFIPSRLPLKYIPSNKILKQLEKTTLLLGMLNEKSKDFSHEEIFLLQYQLMLKEAAQSSEIEGTRSTIADVLKEEKIEEKDPEKRLDNQEVRNYRCALQFGLEKVKETGKISEELLKEIHKKLLDGVRGRSKSPGEYKYDQNGIGKRQDTLDTARFVPCPPGETPGMMKNLMEFINSDDKSALYKIAVVHYQFETVHPFRDGNGRLGRLLIMLQICQEGILDHPLLYLSEFFNRNRDTYTDNLFDVSSKGDLDKWLIFFFKAIEAQAKESMNLLKELQDYKQELKDKMHGISRSPNMHLLIDYLFKHPFITATEVRKTLNVTQPGAWGLIKKLEKEDILRPIDTTKEGRVYSAHRILKIMLGRDN